MEEKIKIGDIVRLKGQPNGPVMTVTKKASQSHLVGSNQLTPQKAELVCAWFDDKGYCADREFHPDALQKVTPSLLSTKVRRGMTLALSDIMEAKGYTLSDMEKCFNESRLTNPMAGFKHDSFEAFLAFQRKSNIPPVPDLGTEEGYFHWYTTSECSDIKPLRAESLSREEVLRFPTQIGMHSIFLVAEKSVPPKTWEEVWASITDIYENEDGAWVRRPLPAEKESEDEWHYIISVTELERQDSDKVRHCVFVQNNAGLPDEIEWFKGKPSALRNATMIHPSNARIKKSDLK